eukprot:739212-Rhodomonas_salina.1
MATRVCKTVGNTTIATHVSVGYKGWDATCSTSELDSCWSHGPPLSLACRTTIPQLSTTLRVPQLSTALR